MADSSVRRGGGMFVFEGEVASPPRESVNQTSGEVSWYVEVHYWGGKASLRLGAPEQRSLLVGGVWCRLEAPIREFQRNMYPGRATVTHVDGKPVSAASRS